MAEINHSPEIAQGIISNLEKTLKMNLFYQIENHSLESFELEKLNSQNAKKEKKIDDHKKNYHFGKKYQIGRSFSEFSGSLVFLSRVFWHTG